MAVPHQHAERHLSSASKPKWAVIWRNGGNLIHVKAAIDDYDAYRIERQLLAHGLKVRTIYSGPCKWCSNPHVITDGPQMCDECRSGAKVKAGPGSQI